MEDASGTTSIEPLRRSGRTRPGLSFTVVTALVDIGREQWQNGYERSFDKYIRYFKHMSLRMDVPLVVFIEREWIDTIQRYRQRMGLNDKTLIRPIAFKQYRLYQHRTRIAAIQQSARYRKASFVDPACPEVSVPDYDIVVNNKVQFVHEVAQENPFCTDYFIWLDAGYGHAGIPISPRFKWSPQLYLQLAADKDRVVMMTLDAEMECTEPWAFFRAHQDFIVGGFFVASRASIKRLNDVYYACIERTLQDGLIDDDQFYMALVYAQHPEWFCLLPVGSWSNIAQIFQ